MALKFDTYINRLPAKTIISNTARVDRKARSVKSKKKLTKNNLLFLRSLKVL